MHGKRATRQAAFGNVKVKTSECVVGNVKVKTSECVVGNVKVKTSELYERWVTRVKTPHLCLLHRERRTQLKITVCGSGFVQWPQHEWTAFGRDCESEGRLRL